MEKSGLWSKQKAADFLFLEMVADPEKRKEKLNNWIARKKIPKKCMDKIGKEIIFFEDKLKQWLEDMKRTAA